MKKRSKKTLLIILPILFGLVILLIFYIYAQDEKRIQLEEFQLDGFSIRTFKFKEDDGRWRGLCAVYWKVAGEKCVPLNKKDIDKILEANYKKGWRLIEDDNLYMRFVHNGTKTEATYRKLDYKFGIYSADFVAWRKSREFSNKDADIFYSIVR